MIEETTPSLDEMRYIYGKWFSLGYIKGNFKEKIALISLLCALRYELRKKKSNVNFYELLMKIDPSIPIDFAKGLTVICEDFAYECSEFETFGLQIKDYPKTIKEILHKLLPF